MFKTSAIIIFVILSSVQMNEALRAHERPHEHPWYHRDNCSMTATKECPIDDHEHHCHHEEFDHIHLCIGDSIALPGKCQQMTCLHYDGDVVLIRGCPEIHPHPGCHLTLQDNSKPYPYCCPVEVCGQSDE